MSTGLIIIGLLLLASTAGLGRLTGAAGVVARVLTSGGGAAALLSGINLPVPMPTTLLGWAVVAGAAYVVSSLVKDALKAALWLAAGIAVALAAYIYLTTGWSGLVTQWHNLVN